MSRGAITHSAKLNGWKNVAIRDIGNVVTGKTPAKANPDHWGDSLDFVTPSDIKTDSKYIGKVARKLSNTGAEHFGRMRIPPNSVLVTCIGSDMGKVVVNLGECVTNQQINSIVVNSNYCMDYVYYALKCSYSTLRTYAIGGSTMPILNKSTFEGLSLSIPPLPEQKAIASVLSSLDDKIELLRRQNETLEQIAQTIFKEWFVEFNFPDKKGKPYKASGGKMVDSDLGPIPNGWRVVSLYDVAKYINGAAFRQDDLSSRNVGLPIIKIAELKDGLTANTKYTEKSVSEDIVLQDDDILFSWSGSPETSIDIFVWHLGKGILNQHTFRVVPHKSTEKVWVYNLLRHRKALFVEMAKQKQTTGLGHVTVSNLKDTKTVCPDEGLLSRYNEAAQPRFAKYCLNLKAICTLARTRDTLLPKLMSGGLRVKGDMD